MPIPNGGLITETNRQYYAGAQQFNTAATASVGQTFTSTFDTNLAFSGSDPASVGYNQNNFKIFTSPDANTWTELVPTSVISSTTGKNTAAIVNVGNPVALPLTVTNPNVLKDMTVVNASTGAVYGTVLVDLPIGNTNVSCNITTQIPASTDLRFQFASPWTEANNIVTVNAKLPASTYLKIQMNDDALGDMHGSYEYTRLDDIINNFLIAYVGPGKLIPSVKRTDVIFHAKRGLQEFSYDTLKSVKSQELTIPENLSLIIPQDYVNYVRLSFVDNMGVQHTIFPANELTLRPYATPAQDNDGVPTQDSANSNLETTSQITKKWDDNNPRKISGAYLNDYSIADVYWTSYYDGALGQRYGLNPETSQRNGWFIIDDRKGLFAFSSNLKEKLIILEYISDGNAYDLDARIPKMAEEALYAHILYSILSTSVGVQEYIVQRFKRERSAKLRNAKIRLSNLKLDQIVQVMRNKSKWIKY
jgi:hypothetical protein